MIQTYCDVCGKKQPISIDIMRQDAQFPDQGIWGDIYCSVCHLVLKSITVPEEGIYEFRKIAELPYGRGGGGGDDMIHGSDIVDRMTLGRVEPGTIALWIDDAISQREAIIADLREAITLLKQAACQSHTGHWDPTGGRGRGCPECIRASELRDRADELLASISEREK